MKSLAANLIMKGKMKTTEARAKEARGLVERLITKTKTGDLPATRYAYSHLDKKSAAKLVKEIAPRYKDRVGGYTRISKLGRRAGDAAPVVVIELV